MAQPLLVAVEFGGEACGCEHGKRLCDLGFLYVLIVDEAFSGFIQDGCLVIDPRWNAFAYLAEV